MKAHITTIILCLLAAQGLSQTFEELRSSGYKLYKEGKYALALEHLQQAKALNSNDTRTLFQSGRVLLKLGEVDKATQAIDRSIDFDTSDLVRFIDVQRDSSIARLWTHPDWPKFVDKLEKKVCGSNLLLFRHLMEIYREDDACRRKVIRAGKTHGWKSPQVEHLTRDMHRIDSLHLEDIRAIIRQHGYPGRSLVGQASKVAFLVIQHSDLETQEAYFPLLMQEADRGELPRKTLALMEDRILISQGKKQKFGTQICRDPDTEQAEFCPIEDPQSVNERRLAVGLSTLETYAKQNGIKWE